MKTKNVKQAKKVVAFVTTVILVFSVLTVGLSSIASAGLTEDSIDNDGEFNVTINEVSPSSPVTAGEQIDVNWTVENIGTEAGVRNMTFNVTGVDVDFYHEEEFNETHNLNLSAGENYNYENDTYENFTWMPEMAGDYTLNVTAVGWNTTDGNYTYHEGHEVTITVEPAAVDRVEITPAEDLTLTAGEEQNFSATAYDQYDNMITDDDTDFTWNTTDNYGFLNTTTTTAAGDYHVNATYNGVTSDTVTVTVNEYELVFDTEPGTITAGTEGMFTVKRQYANGSVIEDGNLTVELYEADDMGMFRAESGGAEVENVTIENGNSTVDFYYYCEIAGDRTITAHNTTENVTGVETTLTVEPASVDWVEITPSMDFSLTAGEEQNFSATAYDAFNNTITEDDTDFTWNTTDNYGFLNTTTSTALGDYLVNATYNGVTSDTVTVTVNEYELVFSTEPGSITAGSEGMFTVQRQYANGSVIEDGNLTVELSEASDMGMFRAESEGAGVANVTIEDGNSTVDFYYYCTIAGDRTITAHNTTESVTAAETTLTVDPLELTITSTEGGSVEVPGEGTFEYNYNETVNLEAASMEGYQFVEWTNETTNIENTTHTSTNITMMDHYTINATFEQITIVDSPDTPAAGATDVGLNPELTVPINYPDNESMNLMVTFYGNMSGETPEMIGSDNGTHGEDATITWDNLAYGTEYEWYVQVTEYAPTIQQLPWTSDTWSFTTQAPEVTSIEVVTQPTTLEYTEGDSLDLSGMEVELTYNDSTTENVAFADFGDYDLEATPSDGDTVNVADHNGTTVTVTHTPSGETAETDSLTIQEAEEDDDDEDEGLDMMMIAGIILIIIIILAI
ncbi:MAG: hypothetical protein V5A76_06760, partial [Candidatus Thermoplasmatota archaeon]